LLRGPAKKVDIGDVGDKRRRIARLNLQQDQSAALADRIFHPGLVEFSQAERLIDVCL